MYGLASSVVDPQGLTVSTGYDAAGRPTSSSVSKSGSTLGSVSYQYANGMLKTLSRTTGSSTQSYNFTYDSFGYDTDGYINSIYESFFNGNCVRRIY
jgi:YD repeat-containing protein